MADLGASKLSESNNVHDRSCCGVVEHAAITAREKRSSRTTRQPWIVLKLMVFLTIGILGYASYVYIGRLCLPIIRKHSGAPAGRGTGIALLVVYAILLLWVVWAYLKVILTPPGFAKDYIPKSAKPLLPPANPLRISWQSGTPDMELGIGEPTQTLSRHQTQPSLSAASQSQYPIGGIGGPSYEDMLMSPRKSSSVRYSSGEMDNKARLPIPVVKQEEEEGPEKEAELQSAAGVRDVTPKTSLNGEATLAGNSVGEPQSKDIDISRKASRSSRKKPSTHITRRPPTTAVLLPAHRYCSQDEFVKPYRAHHCRACGTCVLKYDHHCPWIGQCVGARNHKFFLNFCQAAFVFSAFVFATLIVYTVRMMNASSSELDPQMIVIIALAGLFALFTSTLVVNHVHMIMKGQTTVESMSIRSMKERESATLQRAYSWWEFGARRRTLKEWDHEWGALSTEGNIWWTGSRGGEWFSVMGSNVLGWVFPIGRSSDDGLSYPVNLRFDEDGRWRRRVEWPEALR